MPLDLVEAVQITPIMPEFGDADLRAISADSRPAIKGSARPSSALKVFLGAPGATQVYRDGVEMVWWSRMSLGRSFISDFMPNPLHDVVSKS